MSAHVPQCYWKKNVFWIILNFCFYFILNFITFVNIFHCLLLSIDWFTHLWTNGHFYWRDFTECFMSCHPHHTWSYIQDFPDYSWSFILLYILDIKLVLPQEKAHYILRHSFLSHSLPNIVLPQIFCTYYSFVWNTFLRFSAWIVFSPS